MDNLPEGNVAQTVDATEVAEILQSIPARLHQVLDRAALETPDHPAFIEDDLTWSYRQLSEFLPQVAGSLESLGVRPGDRMMIISENSIAMAALLLAASRINAWAIVVNPRLSPRELDQIREHSGARRMFFTAGVSKEAAAHASRVNATVQDVGPLREIAVGALNEAAIVEPLEESSARQVAVLIYTSGTTGTPKGVMLTHENLLFSAKTSALFRWLDHNDKVYVVLPISHIVGISLLLMTLMSGGTVRLVSRYDPASLVKAMVEERITVLNGVPATFQRLLEYKAVARLPSLDKGALRLIAGAGAPLDLDLKSRIEQELGLSPRSTPSSPRSVV